MTFEGRVQFAQEKNWHNIIKTMFELFKDRVPTQAEVAKHLNMKERNLAIDLQFMEAFELLTLIEHQPNKYRYQLTPLGKQVFDEINKKPDQIQPS